MIRICAGLVGRKYNPMRDPGRWCQLAIGTAPGQHCSSEHVTERDRERERECDAGVALAKEREREREREGVGR